MECEELVMSDQLPFGGLKNNKSNNKMKLLNGKKQLSNARLRKITSNVDSRC